MKRFGYFCGVLSALCIIGCSNDEPVCNEPGFGAKEESLVVINSGNFMYSNSSLTVWNEEDGVDQDVFATANGFKLGDVAQSATVHGDLLWIVVNNSNIIYAVDRTTYKEVGRIDSGITSPRYIHFVSDDKAYVTQMYTNKIAIVDPKTYSVTGYIDLRTGGIGDGSTEEMVQVGDYVCVNQWSSGNCIAKIDTRTDEELDAYRIGIQPYSIVKDYEDYLWVLCDGGAWAENPAGYEAPTLVKMSLTSRVVGHEDWWEKLREFEFPLGASVSKMCTNGIGTRLYFIVNEYDEEGKNVGGVYMLDVTEQYPQFKIVVPSEGRYLYSLTVSPNTEDIFVADALDYQQAGVIYRYSKDGRLLGQFEAGVIPSAYAWNRH